jgi:hypothetical protein
LDGGGIDSPSSNQGAVRARPKPHFVLGTIGTLSVQSASVDQEDAFFRARPSASPDRNDADNENHRQPGAQRVGQRACGILLLAILHPPGRPHGVLRPRRPHVRRTSTAALPVMISTIWTPIPKYQPGTSRRSPLIGRVKHAHGHETGCMAAGLAVHDTPALPGVVRIHAAPICFHEQTLRHHTAPPGAPVPDHTPAGRR